MMLGRTETALITEIAQHAAEQACQTVIRIADTLPGGQRIGVVMLAFLVLAGKAHGLRQMLTPEAAEAFDAIAGDLKEQASAQAKVIAP